MHVLYFPKKEQNHCTYSKMSQSCHHFMWKTFWLFWWASGLDRGIWDSIKLPTFQDRANFNMFSQWNLLCLLVYSTSLVQYRFNIKKDTAFSQLAWVCIAAECMGIWVSSISKMGCHNAVLLYLQPCLCCYAHSTFIILNVILFSPSRVAAASLLDCFKGCCSWNGS